MPFEPKLSERKQGNFKLNQDVRSEFIRTARSNQLRQAMEYLIDIVDSFAVYTESLEARIEDLEAGGRARDIPTPANVMTIEEDAATPQAADEEPIEKPRPVKRATKKAAPKPEADAE